MTRSAQPSAIGPQPVCGCSVSSAGAGHGIVSSASICPGAGRGARSAIRNSQSTTGLRRFGFTLVEIAIVFAIIAVLVVVIAMVSTKARTAAKVIQTRAIMESVMMAMQEYKLAGHSTPPAPFDPDDVPTSSDSFITSLPPGSDEFRTDFFREPSNLKGDFAEGTNDNPKEKPSRGEGSAPPRPPGWVAYSVKPNSGTPKFVPDGGTDGKRIYGIQSLYYYLVREPNSKRVLGKVPPGNLVSPDKISAEMGFQYAGTMMATDDPDDPALPSRVSEVLVLLDAWGRPMYYDMDNTANNHQPALQSAGPDGLFGTDDDIWSFKK